MTFQRVINRNGLADGDYQTPPTGWQKQVNNEIRKRDDLTDEQQKLMLFDFVAKRVDEYEMKAKILAGDLRRLEADAIDENGICTRVAIRTGIDAEVVAAVLKEFIAW